MKAVKLDSHAKINLSLRVTGRRPDGYHDIVSFMQGTGLCDAVEITECSENGTKYNFPHCIIGGIVVYLCTASETMPTDRSNLIFSGIEAFLEAYAGAGSSEAALPSGLIVSIDKRLPVAAGIAGGSGNAAVCMLGLNALLGFPLSLRELMRAGAAVGADVPFSVFMNAYRNRSVLKGLDGIEEAGDAAWTGGIGDIVEAAEPVPRTVIMANPGKGVSTKAAYEAMDRIGYSDRDASERKLFVNDMEKYTLEAQPSAKRLRQLMLDSLDADEVLMSGSGPTMVAYYTDNKKAEEGFRRLSELTKCEKDVRIWKTDTGRITGEIML